MPGDGDRLIDTVERPAARAKAAPAKLPVRVEIDARSQLNFAMVENAIPLVERISITNTGAEPLRDLDVSASLLPAFSKRWTARATAIDPDSTYHLSDVDLQLPRNRFVNLLESERTELFVEICGHEAGAYTSRIPIELLAYNEWHAATLPHLLSAFVMPNHPVIAEVLSHARVHLEKRTGSPAFDGYQSKRPARVLAMTAAIYDTLQALDVTYATPPASFELAGQKIRTPEQVLGRRMGTCLDLTVFLAACLEQAGLHPLLFVIKEHALPGVWLTEEDLAAGATDDPSLFRKLQDLGAVTAFDSSTVASRPLVPFEQAQTVAERLLADDEQFRYAVDVRASRRLKFRPLPARLPHAFAALAEPPPASQRAEDPNAARTRTAILERTRGLPELAIPEEAEPKPSKPIARLEIWKQKLLDLSLRNRLVSFKETKAALRLLCPDIATFEDLLANGKELWVAGKPAMLSEADPRHAEQLARRTGEGALNQYLTELLAKGTVHTDQSHDELQRRLKGIAKQAKETLEETGANTLCFAIGMLRWFESESSDVARLAPLLLVPARIEKRKDAYRVASSDDDARINVTLLEKLRNDFDVVIPELDELPEDDAGIDVSKILSLVRAAVVALPRWDVIEDVHLAHFTFTKFMMWRDLQDRADSLLDNELVRHLVLGRGQPFPDQGEFTDLAEMDDRYQPSDLLCPLDADSTQLAAIAAGLDDKSFVLQGPPGTGKSQTITNLIAAALAAGKRVLFVAEKMAALEVVHTRLEKAGFGDFCLQLHSHNTNKRAVVDELSRTLNAQSCAEPKNWPEHEQLLIRERGHLNGYARALHAEREDGLNTFRALSKLIGLRDVRALAIDADLLDEPTRRASIAAIHNLARAALEVIPIANNPWRQTRPLKFGITTEQKVAQAIDALADATLALEEALATSGAESLPEPPSAEREIVAWTQVTTLLGAEQRAPASLLEASDWPGTRDTSQSLIALGSSVDDRRKTLLDRYREGFFDLELEALAARFRRWGAAFFLVAWWMLRSAKAALRRVSKLPKLPAAGAIEQDLEAAIELRAQAAKLDGLSDAGRRYFGPAWDAPDRDWERLDASLDWASAYRRAMDDLGAQRSSEQRAALIGLARDGAPTNPELDQACERWRRSREDLAALLGCSPEDISGPVDEPALLSRLARSLRTKHEHLRELRSWHHYAVAEAAARELKLSSLIDGLRAGDLRPDELGDVFERSFLLRWLTRSFDEEPILSSFSGTDHRERIEHFVTVDETVMGLARDVARARIMARFPRDSSQAASSSEVGVLLREAAKKRRHMPIRRLFERIPTLIERIKPCILMSPLSVSQYLDPGAAPFDIVVFDEASQIPTHDAIGALARGRKAIVVGDSKQLPPTSFFSRADDGDVAIFDDDEHFVELESILDECVASRVPERLLGWHYRSRHESLIAFSNHYYYDNRLHTFPSATDQSARLGVSLKLINGHYDRGKSSTNRREAEAVVAEITARLLDAVESKRSIGVVTFNRKQQDLIEDLLEAKRQEHPEIEPFFNRDNVAEPVIIKNLENIQGDERDVMFFSICYGPDVLGRVSANFGPLNQEGGERRLNVAVTRAREQLIVFSTLTAHQIDLKRTKARGVHHLKTFLEYAERGPRAIAEATALTGALDFDSPFEKDVYQRLTALGWDVLPQVGCAGYRIDLGIRHPDKPGQFVLGIECDGAAYHAAKSARDRDRLRAQVLSGLGWRLHRIWSTDWWHQPERELRRADEAIRAALDAPQDAPKPAVNAELFPNSATETDAPAPDTSRPLAATVPEPPQHPTYVPAAIESGVRQPDDFYDQSRTKELVQIAWQVLEVEAPITLHLLAKRLGPRWGLAKTTKRVEKRLIDALARRGRQSPVEHGGALWLPDQVPTDVGFRIAGPAPESRRDVNDVPTDEIANAAAFVLQTSLSLDRDALARETARLLGYARFGRRVAERMDQGIELILATGRAKADGTAIRVAP